jgi:multisubunit Na+/H+ antiporter MnhE subunit
MIEMRRNGEEIFQSWQSLIISVPFGLDQAKSCSSRLITLTPGTHSLELVPSITHTLTFILPVVTK